VLKKYVSREISLKLHLTAIDYAMLAQ